MDLELDPVDKTPIVEEIILPEHSLTLEKIHSSRNKDRDSKEKLRRRSSQSNSSDGRASFADDHDSDGKNDEESEDKSEQEEKTVALEVGDDALETKVVPNANAFTASKNVAQGMMDIALITANANQLRYILAYNQGSSTYYINLFLVSTSLLLQISVGLCLILKAKYKKQSDPKTSKQLSNFIVIGVFLVTIINVFIASFTDTTNSSNSAVNGYT